MGHAVNHITAERNVDRNQILAEIQFEVEHEDWQEGGSYHGNLTWHDGKVYADKQEAYEAIDRFDNGWYSDHAVLFHDTEAVKPTKTIETLEKRLKETSEARSAYITANMVTTRKSAYIGCPKCGSKLNREYLHGNACPLCRTDLRSETVLGRIKAYDTKAKQIEAKIRAERKKQAAKAPIRWLIKYEYHV